MNVSVPKKEKKDEVAKRETTDIHIAANFSPFGGRGVKFGKWSVGFVSGVDYTHDFDTIAEIPERTRPYYLRIRDGVDISLEISPVGSSMHVRRATRSPELRKSIEKAAERIQKRLSKSKRLKR